MVTQPPSPPLSPPSPESPSETSTGRVVVAAILCWVLGVWFGNLLELIQPALIPLGYLTAVWIASRIAKERVLTAAIPTGAFFLLLILAAISLPEELKSPLSYALRALGTGAACLMFAWWLGRREAVKLVAQGAEVRNGSGELT